MDSNRLNSLNVNPYYMNEKSWMVRWMNSYYVDPNCINYSFIFRRGHIKWFLLLILNIHNGAFLQIRMIDLFSLTLYIFRTPSILSSSVQILCYWCKTWKAKLSKCDKTFQAIETIRKVSVTIIINLPPTKGVLANFAKAIVNGNKFSLNFHKR